MLGARIAALRKDAGWNQAELARRLQVSPSAVGMYERDQREPSADMLLSIARAFGVSVDYLISGQPSPDEEAIVQRLLTERITTADCRLEARRNRPFSREELVVLFAAMLMEG